MVVNWWDLAEFTYMFCYPLFDRKVSNYLGDVLEEQRDKVFMSIFYLDIIGCKQQFNLFLVSSWVRTYWPMVSTWQLMSPSSGGSLSDWNQESNLTKKFK